MTMTVPAEADWEDRPDDLPVLLEPLPEAP